MPLFGEEFPFRFVVPLTSTARAINLHVELAPSASNGLARTSYAQCELQPSVAVSRLDVQLGAAGEADLQRVRVVLARLFGLAVRNF